MFSSHRPKQLSPLADLRGAPGTRPSPPRGPNSFIFMQFSVKIGQNSRLAPQPEGWRALRLANPGSATGHPHTLY